MIRRTEKDEKWKRIKAGVFPRVEKHAALPTALSHVTPVAQTRNI